MGFDNFSEGDWQNFIYLSIVLLLLISGLLSRSKLSLAKTAKYFLLWSLVGLVAIICYSYRFEFNDFKGRILSEINPSQARIVKGGKVVINVAEDGHYYVNLKLNGTIVRFMVDTGASEIMLNARDAKKIGVDMGRLIFNRSYQTANGHSWGASVTISEVQLGDLIFKDVATSVSEADMGTSLLGMSFLRRFKKYEFYQDRLELSN